MIRGLIRTRCAILKQSNEALARHNGISRFRQSGDDAAGQGVEIDGRCFRDRVRDDQLGDSRDRAYAAPYAPAGKAQTAATAPEPADLVPLRAE